MEASEGVVCGNVESLTKLVEALNAAGIELIGDGAVSQSGGRGVRLRTDSRIKDVADQPDLNARADGAGER